ncbi:MAG: glycosyltransferase family 4 protein, partial [bacterium]
RSATSGAERHVVDLARLFTRSGHHVEAACPHRGNIARDFSSINVRSHELDMKSAGGLRALGTLLKLVGRDRFDVVHVHLSRATYLGLVACRLRRVPLVSTVHVLTREPVYNLVAKKGRLVAVSNYIQRQLIAKGVPSSSIDVVYNGTDMDLHSYGEAVTVHEEFDIPRSRKLVGLVGRVAPEKGHMLAVQALPQVLEKHPDAHVMFVGRQDGDYAEELQAETARLKVEDRVTFTGNRNDVPRFFDSMEFSILPSVMESFGLAVIECFARGRPVVATNVGALPELVLPNVTGLLCERNPESLAGEMDYMFRHEAERHQMGHNARRMIEEKFSAAEMVKRLEEVYIRAGAKL